VLVTVLAAATLLPVTFQAFLIFVRLLALPIWDYPLYLPVFGPTIERCHLTSFQNDPLPIFPCLTFEKATIKERVEDEGISPVRVIENSTPRVKRAWST
jgi:hypothetical protein